MSDQPDSEVTETTEQADIQTHEADFPEAKDLPEELRHPDPPGFKPSPDAPEPEATEKTKQAKEETDENEQRSETD